MIDILGSPIALIPGTLSTSHIRVKPRARRAATKCIYFFSEYSAEHFPSGQKESPSEEGLSLTLTT